MSLLKKHSNIMGNYGSQSYTEIPQEQQSLNLNIQATDSVSSNSPQPESTSTKTEEKTTAKPYKSDYIHPLIEMINRHHSESEMINMLETYCGTKLVGVDEFGNNIYEYVDQLSFFGPVMEVFAHCSGYGKKSVLIWLLEKYVPLDVSYDNNFCYFESLRYSHYTVTEMIVNHESFHPSLEVLENLLSRNKYELFNKCMSSPHLKGDLYTYRYTFQYYIINKQYQNINVLLQNINKRLTGQEIEISDKIYSETEVSVEPTVLVEPVSSTMTQSVNQTVVKDTSEKIHDEIGEHIDLDITVDKTQNQSEVQPETQLETQPENQLNVQTETQLETQLETQIDVQPETQLKTQLDVQPDTQSDVQPQTEPIINEVVEPVEENKTEFNIAEEPNTSQKDDNALEPMATVVETFTTVNNGNTVDVFDKNRAENE